MGFKRNVEVGRVVMLTYGPDYGKLAVIVEIIDHGRVLVEGPTTGVARQALNFKRCSLTDIVLSKIPRGVGSVALKKAVEKQGLEELWGKTGWGKKVAKRTTRANLTDFDRFKLMVARKNKTAIVAKSFASAKKAFAKQ
ncbi:ribosomal protein L14-domain-containing protein [Gorgonomyces haynaldii]|nr:ribosomal protein L14-domain-containing protein [Gorgonomyces haynaldii]